MPAGSGQGWSDLDVPVADMLTPFQKPDTRQSWARQPDGYIYRAERADPITGKVGRFAISSSPQASARRRRVDRRATACSGSTPTGTDLTGWDLINFLPNFIAPATQMRKGSAAASSGRAATTALRRSARPYRRSRHLRQGDHGRHRQLRKALHHRRRPRRTRQRPQRRPRTMARTLPTARLTAPAWPPATPPTA